MNKINEIIKLNQMELEKDIPFESSWHQTYKNCPWVYFGGVSTELSEGDIICLFSQFVQCYRHSCLDGEKWRILTWFGIKKLEYQKDLGFYCMKTG